MYHPERYTRDAKFLRRHNDRSRINLVEAVILITAGAVLGATIIILGLPA